MFDKPAVMTQVLNALIAIPKTYIGCIKKKIKSDLIIWHHPFSGGETIKNIKEQSRAHVELQRNPPPNTDPNVRIFSIRGTPQQLEKARQLINERIGVGGLAPAPTVHPSPKCYCLVRYSWAHMSKQGASGVS